MNRILIGAGQCKGCRRRLPPPAVVTTRRAWAAVPLCSTCDAAALEEWERRQQLSAVRFERVTKETP